MLWPLISESVVIVVFRNASALRLEKVAVNSFSLPSNDKVFVSNLPAALLKVMFSPPNTTVSSVLAPIAAVTAVAPVSSVEL